MVGATEACEERTVGDDVAASIGIQLRRVLSLQLDCGGFVVLESFLRRNRENGF